MIHDNIANNCMWVDLAGCTCCMLCHVACPCWISEMFPGACCILWGIKSIARLAGALLCL